MDGGGDGDAELLHAVAEGDRRAFEVFYTRHSPWLIARLRQRCPDQGVVEDVVQDTFVAVWRGAARFRPYGDDGDGTAAGWLWRIGHRRLVDATRGHGSRQSLLRRLVGLADRRDEPSAEEQVLREGRHGDLADALGKLPPELGAVLYATAVDGLTVREAATRLSVPVGTVKTRAMRARRLLRQHMPQYMPPPQDLLRGEDRPDPARRASPRSRPGNGGTFQEGEEQ